MPKPRQSYSYVQDWKSLLEPDLEAIACNGASCDPTKVDPKVLQWVKKNCSAHTPHFIKIINENATNGRSGLKNASCCRLSVPRPFVKERFRELDRVVTLENDEGKTWRVSFGSAKRDPCWQQGWTLVATENEIEPGEVIVFVLLAYSRFHFTRFDAEGNLISGKKSTQSETLNATTAIKKQFATVPNPEESLHRRSSWKAKRAAAQALRMNQCAQISGVGTGCHSEEASQVIAPAEKLQNEEVSKRVEEVSNKRRRLCKMEEIKSKFDSNSDLTLSITNEHLLYDSEEAGFSPLVARE